MNAEKPGTARSVAVTKPVVTSTVIVPDKFSGGWYIVTLGLLKVPETSNVVIVFALAPPTHRASAPAAKRYD